MGAQYKVGDRVRIVSSPFCGETRQAGGVGTVSRVPSRVRGDVEIEFKGDAGPWGFHFREIEHADYKPVPGDRVRVVLEGEYRNGHIEVVGSSCWLYENAIASAVSIEKIEPPVEVFKPGDRLRSKTMNFEVTLASDGYLHHFRDGEVEFFSVPKADSFTSKDYEKVSLG